MKNFRFGLLEVFVLFIGFLFLADTGLQYAVSTSTERKVSREVLNQTAAVIEHQTAAIRESTEYLLSRAMNSAARNSVDFSDFRSANAYFLGHILAHPHVTSVNYGDSAGNGYLLLLEPGRWRNRIKKNSNKGIVTWVFIDNNGKALSQEQRKDDYDPRVRPWYSVAAGSPGIHWSRPYIFRTTRDVGITASLAIDPGKDGSARVIGADVMLKDLSQFFSRLKSRNADLSIHLVSREGEILASSEVDAFVKSLRKESDELPRISDDGFQDLSAASRAFQREGSDFLSFASSGKSYYAVRRPFSISPEQRYYMVLTVPHQSFLSFFGTANKIRALLYLVMVAASGFFFATRYLAPLRKLTGAVHTFGTDAYEPPSTGDRKDEVGVLVSEFRGMADDLTARQRELTSLVNNVPGMVYRGRRDWSISFVGAEVEQVTGYASGELTSGAVNWREIIHPDDFERVKEVLKKAAMERSATLRLEYRIRRKDGDTRWIEDRRQLIYDESGALASVDGLLLDVSERKKAEKAQKHSEEMYRVLSDQSPLGKALIDGQGRYEYVNPAFEAIFGYTLHDLPTGAEWFRVAFPDAAKREEAVRFWKEDLAHAGIGENRPRILDVVCKGGASKTILFRSVSLEGNKQLVVYEDITERRRMESQLQQASKMEAVGRLAGGIAHDFNNILTVITGYSELLLQKIGKGSPMHAELDEIKRAGDRAAAMTQQLLAFSRKQIIEPKVMRLDRLVTEVHAMLARLIGENIDLQTITGKSLGSVKIDPGQFQQILVNLAVNARDAMPGGGKIVIETANVELDEGYCALHPYVKPGRFVMLSVGDTGKGMGDDVKAHIFEPFFTTKEKGRGTGLGLATTYGAVKQSGGSIEVYSEVGIGTTFKIYLPRVEEEAVIPGDDILPADLPGGTETVLLVEDEETVRNLGVRILRDLGYRMMQARNGEEAIALATGYEERIDLLLTDVVMPGMNGSELAARLVPHQPEMKVLFTSGYTDDAIVHHGVLDEGVLFIGKPYTPLALAKKVRRVLDKA